MVKKIYNFIDRKLGVKEMLRYGSVGLMGALIDFSLLNIFVQLTTLDIYHSVTLAFLISVVVSYLLHCHWTFCVAKGATRLMVYAFTSLFGLVFNIVIMYFLMEHLHWWYNYAKLAAMLIVLVWNYFVSKTIIFKKRINI